MAGGHMEVTVTLDHFAMQASDWERSTFLSFVSGQETGEALEMLRGQPSD
jgi:hypothetical protein